MKSRLLPLALCAVLGGCAAYGDPYGYGYGYPSASPYGGVYAQPGYSYGPSFGGSVYIDGRRGGGRGYGDRDRDGIPNRLDRDRDNDGIPNRLDRDRDGDGVRNRQDSRPNNPRRN
jgi:hypothetical protein